MTPYSYYIAAILLLCGCLVGFLVQVKYDDVRLVDFATNWQRLTAFIKDKPDFDSCQALLDGVVSGRKNALHLVCEEHNYDIRDIHECFRRAVEYDGRPNHIVFLGDSRIREQFQYFIQFLGSNKTSSEYANTEYSLNVTYLSHRQPLNHQYLLKLEQISNLPSTERPRLLATSAALWDIMISWPHVDEGFSNFTDTLYKARPLFERLSNTTDILWTIQAPIAEAVPDVKRNKVTRRCVELESDCKGWYAREKWLLRSHFNRFNDAARRILTNSSIRFWAEYRQAGHRYAFDLHDGIHLTHRQGIISEVLEGLYLRSLRRPHPPAHLVEKRLNQQLINQSNVPPQWIKSSYAFHDRSQVLINFYCNRHLYKSESDSCCVRPH